MRCPPRPRRRSPPRRAATSAARARARRRRGSGRPGRRSSRPAPPAARGQRARPEHQSGSHGIPSGFSIVESSKSPGLNATAPIETTRPATASQATGRQRSDGRRPVGNSRRAERGHRPDAHQPDPLADPRDERALVSAGGLAQAADHVAESRPGAAASRSRCAGAATRRARRRWRTRARTARTRANSPRPSSSADGTIATKSATRHQPDRPREPRHPQPQRDVGGLDGVGDHAPQVGGRAPPGRPRRAGAPPNASSVRAAS